MDEQSFSFLLISLNFHFAKCLLKPSPLKYFPRLRDRKLSTWYEVVQFLFTALLPCPYLYRSFHTPPCPSPFQGNPFSPFSRGHSFPLSRRFGIARYLFFSYPQSFSCWSIPLTFYKYAWIFPIWRKSDTGFLLSYLPEVLEELSILAFPFLSPSRFLIRYSHSCSSYLLSAYHVPGSVLSAGI